MKRPTRRQKEVLVFVTEFIEERTYPTTYRENGDQFGYNPSAAFRHIKAMVKKGMLNQEAGRTRTIRLPR